FPSFRRAVGSGKGARTARLGRIAAGAAGGLAQVPARRAGEGRARGRRGRAARPGTARSRRGGEAAGRSRGSGGGPRGGAGLQGGEAAGRDGGHRPGVGEARSSRTRSSRRAGRGGARAVALRGPRWWRSAAARRDRRADRIASPHGPQARRDASGGELSRVLLAVKRVLAESDPVDAYLFDEVDAGIGGATAEAVGRALAAVARRRQIICITHLPQIAVFAGKHLTVEKEVVKGRTHSRVAPVEGDDRVQELARLLSGKATDVALE